MTPAELTLAAALGASFLTVCGTLGVVWFQERQRGKAADQDALQSAIGAILSRSMAIAFRARAMGEVMKAAVRARRGPGHSDAAPEASGPI